MIRRGILLSLLFTTAEVGLTAAALHSLVELPRGEGNAAMGILLAGLVVTLAVFALLTARFLAPLGDKPRNGPGSEQGVSLEAVHGLRRGLAIQALLRLLVTIAAASTCATLLIPLGQLPPNMLAPVVATAASTVALVEVWRPMVLGSLMVKMAAQVDPHQGEARWRRETLVWDLTWSGLATGAAGILGVVLFVHFFIPIEPHQRQTLLTLFPATILVIAGLWLLLLRRLMRPVRRYLRAVAQGSATPVHPEVAAGVFRAVQVLPYTLAASKVLAFAAGALLLYVEGVWLFGLDRDAASMTTGAVLLASIAAALYEAFWHRTTLRVVLADLAARHRLDVDAVRSPLSLRVKMLSGFGLVLFVTCAIAIFWSFVQVRNLAVSFVQKQSKLKAEGVLDRLRTQDKIRGPVQPADVSGLLGQLAGAGEEIYWYLPPSGAPERFAAPGSDSPALPFLARTRMRRMEQGVLRHGDLGLVGAFFRLHLGGRNLGSVAVLYPDQTTAATLPGSRVTALAAFFLVLFLMCTGIVVLIVADLSAPLRALEKRAGEMARGDLERPVVTGAEADEVGRLAFALDAMWLSLQKQIRAVEELNVSLEEKVVERTSALAQANSNLREALDRLTRTQDQLVRSEKLASMGQLVAGVAHELNNPLNAVGNTIEPLDAALRALVEWQGAGEAVRPSVAEVEDVRAMFQVIRNGTSRMERIVRALSSYARTDSERVKGVDLNALVQETTEIAGHLLGEGEVELRLDLGALPPVPGDPGQLGQVLMNLLANAVHAVADSPLRRIWVSSRALDDSVEVVVADSGPGIPEALRTRVFDPFFTTKAVGQGTGLGLSISHEIVASHGGTLELVQLPERGAVFRLKLPIYLAKEAGSGASQAGP